MKKIILVLAVLITILSLYKKEKTIIPEESIRFRIIANSNLEKDQEIKKEIVKNISPQLKTIKDFQTIEETRKYLTEELPTLEDIVDNTLKKSHLNNSFHINYGKNFFPEKEYKEVTYPEGEYESLVITLGEGKGENFWCVLFPPICFMDEEEDIEYKSFFKEIIDKYFS